MSMNYKKVNGFGRRLKEEREKVKLSRADVGNMLGGVAISTLQAWEGETREPPISKLVELADILKTTANYLLTGNRSDIEAEHTLVKSNINLLIAPQDDFELVKEFSEVQVSAGFGAYNQDYQASSFIKVEKSWLQARQIKAENCLALTVGGDSMYPTLNDSDKILVDTSKNELREGKIFVINHQGSMWVKKIHINFNGIDLISDNPTYPAIKLTTEEANSLNVIGQVVRSYRNF